MASNASIFIPDISGYTEFVSRTELVHSAHIINELLEVLVESNCAGLTLAEIEGDALLFYRTGEPLPFDEMTRQALTMFTNFHQRLNVIERDSICQCGACQTASNLSLKFVVHFGGIEQMRVASFVKASGIDMIIAHRLLKNHLHTKEYLLATERYLAAVADRQAEPELQWQRASEVYPVIGAVPFEYAALDGVRKSIPPAPARPQAGVRLEDQSVEIDVAAPMMAVYQKLIDLNARSLWVDGIRGGDGEQPIDRINTRHFCYFDDFTVEIVPIDRVVSENAIRYAEAFSIAERGLKGVTEFQLECVGADKTRLRGRFGAIEGVKLPADTVAGLLAQMKANLERLKEVCERRSE